MRCDQAQEALSAALDGEDTDVPVVEVDAHLVACSACCAWYDDAARVTRMSRLTGAVTVPDLTDAILGRTEPPRPSRRPCAARAALAVVGLAQFAVAAFQLWQAAEQGSDDGGHLAPGLNAPLHLQHESVAWGFALAVGFCWIALQTRRAAGMVPVLGAFVVVLGALVVKDLVAGVVTPSRVAPHFLVVLGFVLVVYLSHRTGLGSRPFDRVRRTGSGNDRATRERSAARRSVGELSDTSGHFAA